MRNKQTFVKCHYNQNTYRNLTNLELNQSPITDSQIWVYRWPNLGLINDHIGLHQWPSLGFTNGQIWVQPMAKFGLNNWPDTSLMAK